MKLYKYRSLQSFEFIADILCHERFYAAQYFELNDPMEGLFDYEPGTKEEYLEKIVEGKANLRVISFSKDPSNLLLWAHYADGFHGICIEVEIDPNGFIDYEEIIYSPFRTIFSDRSSQEIENWPRYILRGKNESWYYEKEVRVFSRDKFVNTGIRITAIHIGIRTPKVMVETLYRLSNGRFPIYLTKISETSNCIEVSNEVTQAQQ